MSSQKSIHEELAEKTYRELGYDQKTNTFSPPPRKSPVNSLKLPFRIPAIEKTQRQWTSDTGYKASAAWQTANLLRDLTTLWSSEHLSLFSRIPPIISRNPPIDPGKIRRLQTQMEDAARSMVSTFEEGWARPTTKEFLDFIGFAQASLVEIHGDFERCLTDGLIRAEREIMGKYGKAREENKGPMARAGIPTPSRDFPYPPVSSRINPAQYGRLREKLREFTGNEIRTENLSYELFMELCNKTSFLFKRTVEGLWNKLSFDEQAKLKEQLDSLWSRW